MKINQIIEAQYAGKIHDPENFVKDELINFILTKQPSDLTGQEPVKTKNWTRHEWFTVDASGRMSWNWRDFTRAAKLIADHYDLTLSHGKLDNITKRALRSKQIKAFKIKVKENLDVSGKTSVKLIRRIEELDRKIVNLTRLRNRYQSNLDEIRDKHES